MKGKKGQSTVKEHLLLSPEDEDLREFCFWLGNYAGIVYEKKSIRLHKFLIKRMGLIIPDGFQVDHRNGIKLDCRRENLRVVTEAKNKQNRPDAKGYYFAKKTKTWVAQAKRRYKCIVIGSFKTEEEAKEARKQFLEKESNDE